MLTVIHRVSTGLQNQHAGYSSNLAGDASPNVVKELAPLSPWLGCPSGKENCQKNAEENIYAMVSLS